MKTWAAVALIAATLNNCGFNISRLIKAIIFVCLHWLWLLFEIIRGLKYQSSSHRSVTVVVIKWWWCLTEPSSHTEVCKGLLVINALVIEFDVQYVFNLIIKMIFIIPLLNLGLALALPEYGQWWNLQMKVARNSFWYACLKSSFRAVLCYDLHVFVLCFLQFHERATLRPKAYHLHRWIWEDCYAEETWIDNKSLL